MIAAREALTPAQRALASTQIEAYAQSLLTRLAPRIVGFCWPIRGEFDARPLMARAIATGVTAAMPVVCGGGMFYRAWAPGSAMALDRHGIEYPAAGETLAPDVILMPLVGFDAGGFRLGYGGGYFDRMLAALTPRPLALGIGFELARIADLEPAGWDIPCDYIATEAGLWQRREGALVAVAQHSAAGIAPP